MALARTYRKELGRTVTTVYEGYLDRLSRWSDIQEYLPLLYDSARSCRDARVLELGSRTGNSTLAFLAGTQESHGHVWSNDIDIRHESRGDEALGQLPVVDVHPRG